MQHGLVRRAGGWSPRFCSHLHVTSGKLLKHSWPVRLDALELGLVPADKLAGAAGALVTHPALARKTDKARVSGIAQH